MKLKPELAKSFLRISMWTFWTPHSQGLSRDFELFAHGQAANCLMSEAVHVLFSLGHLDQQLPYDFEKTQRKTNITDVWSVSIGRRNMCWCYQINWCCFIWILAVCWSCFFWRSEARPRTDCFWFILSAGWSVKMAASNIQSLDPPETAFQIGQLLRCNRNSQNHPTSTNQILANHQPLIPLITRDLFLPKVSLMAAPEPPPSWRRRFSLSASRTMVQWALVADMGWWVATYEGLLHNVISII